MSVSGAVGSLSALRAAGRIAALLATLCSCVVHLGAGLRRARLRVVRGAVAGARDTVLRPIGAVERRRRGRVALGGLEDRVTYQDAATDDEDR